MDSEADLQESVRSFGHGELSVHSEDTVWYSVRMAPATGFDTWKALALRFPESGIAPVVVISEFEDWIIDDPAFWEIPSHEGNRYVDLIRGMERDPISQSFADLVDVEGHLMFLLPAKTWADALEYLPIQIFPKRTMRAIVDHFEAEVWNASGWYIHLAPRWKPAKSRFDEFCEVLKALYVTESSMPSYSDTDWFLEFR
jgi:hypothetical protein